MILKLIYKCIGPRKVNLEEQNIKTRYQATVIKTVRYRHRERQIDQWDRI